jgi:hypothetical protein
LAGRKNFVAGEILTAADVNSFLMDQSVMVFDDSGARGSAIPSPSEGMVTYRKDLGGAAGLEVFDGSAFGPVSGILQVVRSTDATNRTTTSTSFVDASISVTITPSSVNSKILLVWSFNLVPPTGSTAEFQITDNSNNAISGAEARRISNVGAVAASFTETMLAYATPGTISAVTFKGRFRSTSAATTQIANATNTGQMYAIEVAG